MCENVLDYPYIIPFNPLTNPIKQWFSMDNFVPQGTCEMSGKNFDFSIWGMYPLLTSGGQGY